MPALYEHYGFVSLEDDPRHGFADGEHPGGIQDGAVSERQMELSLDITYFEPCL
jgi:hypothetical protein